MVVGVCRLWLHLPDNHSLKGKRQVVRSIVERVSNRFNVAIAEVEDQQRWQMASIGFCCVSNSVQHADEVLSRVVAFIESQRSDAQVVEYRTEVVHALDDGIPMP
ncbi:MAG: DUF503 domain-containing protein [Dehalococcoidia bacterium]